MTKSPSHKSDPPEWSSEELPELRTRIDRIDAEIARLIHQRAEVAEHVRLAKKVTGLAVYDPEREEDVIEAAVKRSEGPFPRSAMRVVFREIISGCVSLQQETCVAFVGPVGSFVHNAAHSLFGSSATLLERPTIASALDAVAMRTAAYAIIPFQTSAEGIVVEALDALIERSLSIRREFTSYVSFDVRSRATSFGAIERVYADGNAFTHCRRWLAHNLPKVALIPAASAAFASERAAADPAGAALLPTGFFSDDALPVVANRPTDRIMTTVRFVVVDRSDGLTKRSNRTTIAVNPRGASLGSLLRTFASQGLEVVNIASVPRSATETAATLVLDLAGPRTDPAIAAAIAEIVARGAEVSLLGSYAAQTPGDSGRWSLPPTFLGPRSAER